MKAKFPLSIPERIAVHHSASKRATSFAEVIRWHTDPRPRGNGWPAVGYNYMINRDGMGRPGRVVPQRASAIARRNTGTLSVLVMGDNTRPSQRWIQEQVDSLVDYLDALCVVWPRLRGEIYGHRDVTAKGHASECPGLDIRELARLQWDLKAYWTRPGR